MQKASTNILFIFITNTNTPHTLQFSLQFPFVRNILKFGIFFRWLIIIALVSFFRYVTHSHTLQEDICVFFRFFIGTTIQAFFWYGRPMMTGYICILHIKSGKAWNNLHVNNIHLKWSYTMDVKPDWSNMGRNNHKW